MAGTLTIPRTVLAPGTYDFPATGGQPVADADTSALLTIDRTVTGGLNTAPAATTYTIAIWQSGDGGTTWDQTCAAGDSGGVRTTNAGPVTANTLAVALWPGTGRLARARVVIAGGSVAVAGTLAIT
jgi:hypothetical protein